MQLLDTLILAVDDDPAILRTVSDILTDEGYNVVIAENGAAALAMLATIAPHLVLLDMRMPVMDGWEFAQALREQQRELPIVVMTAAQDARRWAHEVNAVGYIAKPFDLMELLTVVEQNLKR